MAYKFKFNKSIKEMRKILKKTLFVLMLSAIVFNFSSCGDDYDDDDIYAQMLIGDWFCEPVELQLSFYKDYTGYYYWGNEYENEEFEFKWSVKGSKIYMEVGEAGEANNGNASIKDLTENRLVLIIEGKRYTFYKKYTNFY